MQVSGGLSTLLFSNPQTSTLYEQVQAMRLADGKLRADATRIQAQAQANGESVATQVNFTRGPDGKNYASSITLTRTRSETITVGAQDEQEASRYAQPLERSLDDISPARFPLSPSELVEGFAERNQQIGQSIAEASALTELQQADSGVRVHEGLHFRAAGGVAQGITDLDYIEGPDGQYYAIAGKVDVQTSTTSDPEKAKREANAFAQAATAPGDASAQDNFAARGAFSRAADSYGRAFDSTNAPLTEYDMVA